MPATPSDVVGLDGAVTVTKAYLLAMSRALEGRCTTCGPGAMIVATLQRADNLTPLTASVHSDLARRGVNSVLIGQDLEHRSLPGVRLVGLPAGDALEREWDVFVLGADDAWGFVAIDVGDSDVPDLQRRFRWTRTEDRATVERCINLLLPLVSWTAQH